MIEMKKRIKSDGKLDNNDHIMHISFLLLLDDDQGL